ncbi:MAG TPA: zinc ribbon domain-containing protein [Planctomicrobium sp.]|nr:zinc ribbon domain-containing protein [Planctomicrobium sp.]
MPTYDYECKTCQHTWEAFQSIKAPAIKKCPECGKNTARRVIGPGAGIIFKGTGFYITDYRSDSYKKAAAADSTSSSSSEGSKSEGAKSESAKPKASEPKPSSSKKKKAD